MIGLGLSVVQLAVRQLVGSFSPASLFAASEPGVWLDPSDFSTMFQDAAGTTPVTAVGQPVGRILDKSGRGNHATQTTSTSRPVLQQDGNGKYYLRFDGVDDWLITPTITPGTDKAQVFAGVRKLSDVPATILERSANVSTNNGSFGVFVSGDIIGASTTPNYMMICRGTSPGGKNAVGYGAPSTDVLAFSADLAESTSTAEIALRINGVAPTTQQSSTNNCGTGNFLAYPLYIGRRNGTTLPFNGHLYGLIVRFGANLPTDTIASTETWLNGKTGAY